MNKEKDQKTIFSENLKYWLTQKKKTQKDLAVFWALANLQ